MLDVVNLTGVPVELTLGDGEPVSVPDGEALKVVEKATSGLKDTLKTNVRLVAVDGGSSGSIVETPVDLAADSADRLVVLSTPDGVVVKSLGRQTAGSTFGEKVASGLQAAGNLVAQGADYTGDCLSDIGDDIGRNARVVFAESPATTPDCPGARTIVRPAGAPADSIPFVLSGEGEPRVAWVSSPRDAASGQATGKRTHRPMVFIASPLPEVAVLNAHEARISMNVTTPRGRLASDVAPGTLVRVPPSAVAQMLEDSGAQPGGGVCTAVSFTTGNSTTHGSMCGQTGHFLIVGGTKPGVMRMGQTNVLARGRRDLLFGSAVNGAATGCVGVSAGDDACVMGAAISALGGAGGSGATSASYAAGRLLAPSNVIDANGTPAKLPFTYVEDGRRFDTSLPPDVVTNLASHGGFFVVTAGDMADTRTLLWVDDSTMPWTLTTIP
ncbi:MAG: hypothetical protein ACO1OB_05380 [Archangium sp.]